MRRLLFVLMLLPSLVAAQSTYPSGVYPFSLTGGGFTNPFLAPAADNCTTPPYSFSGDATTGVCSSAAGTLNLRTAGTNRFSILSTGATLGVPLYLADGSATAGGVCFVGDTDTCLYLAASNTLALATAGVARLSFTATAVDLVSVAGQYRLASGATRYGNYFIASGESTALTDNTATTFVTMSIPQTAGSSYGGGKISYTIFCKDATNQAVESGEVLFACHNIAGAEACTFGTPSNVIQGDGTANFVAPVFSATAGSDALALKVQSDCSGVTPTTHTIQAFIQQQQNNTLTW